MTWVSQRKSARSSPGSRNICIRKRLDPEALIREAESRALTLALSRFAGEGTHFLALPRTPPLYPLPQGAGNIFIQVAALLATLVRLPERELRDSGAVD